MPARGREGGGGGGASCLAVLGRTRCRSARVRREHGEPTGGARQADDGGRPAAPLVRRAVGDDQPALAQDVGPTGQPGAVNVARPVWRGGKAVKPSLSLPFVIRRMWRGCPGVSPMLACRRETLRSFCMSARAPDMQKLPGTIVFPRHTPLDVERKSHSRAKPGFQSRSHAHRPPANF